jgi:hypothetical protein
MISSSPITEPRMPMMITTVVSDIGLTDDVYPNITIPGSIPTTPVRIDQIAGAERSMKARANARKLVMNQYRLTILMKSRLVRSDATRRGRPIMVPVEPCSEKMPQKLCRTGCSVGIGIK